MPEISLESRLRPAGNPRSAGLSTQPSEEAIYARPDANTDGSLRQNEIAGLDRLPWHGKGFMVLCGCRSAIGDTPTSLSFATRQGVPVLGQMGSAKFSSRWGYLKAHDGADTEPPVFLWAYSDLRNKLVLANNL